MDSGSGSPLFSAGAGSGPPERRAARTTAWSLSEKSTLRSLVRDLLPHHGQAEDSADRSATLRLLHPGHPTIPNIVASRSP